MDEDRSKVTDAYRLRPAWIEMSSERQDYLDMFQDYIPRGQKHFKLKRAFGYARLSARSMEALQKAAQAGDLQARQLLAGNLAG